MKKLSYENADKVMELYKKPLPDKEMKRKLALLFEESFKEGQEENKKRSKKPPIKKISIKEDQQPSTPIFKYTNKE